MNTTEIMHHSDTLFNKILEIDSRLAELETNEVTRAYNGFIRSVHPTSIDLTLSNGTFSTSATNNYNDKCVYLASVTYSTSNALVDRSLYMIYINVDSVLQQTVTLCGCGNGNDNLLVSLRNGTLTFSSTYNGSTAPTKCQIKIL